MNARRGGAIAAMAALLLVGMPRPTQSCCMVPVSWDGDVDQASQSGVVLHHAGHEELVVRVAPFFQTKDKKPLPDVASAAPPFVEWVLTVPSRPTGYRTVPATVFHDADELEKHLVRLAEEQFRLRSRWDGPKWGARPVIMSPVTSLAAAHGLEIGAPVRVGPYEITPVQAHGREALDELNAYLAGRGFPQEDPDHMAWFMDRGFTFLCIHVTPPEGTKQLGRFLDLEPLQIGFDTDRPYYPAKFSSRQGPFALSLTTVTSRPLARSPRAAVAARLRADAPRYDNLWTAQALPAALGKAAEGWGAAGVERWHVNAFRSDGFNFDGPDGRPAIASWTDDVVLDLGGETDDMPGWYYGDRDIGAPERLWREHRVAGGAWAAVVLLFFLGWRGLRLRRRRRLARSSG